jgi:Putative zinc-finger
VAQQNDRHLTIEQLSALLDKQLSQEEEAVFSAHLRTCIQCQGVLADLRQTVSLLHALPQASVPRSFVLPVGIAPVQERPVIVPTTNITPFPAARTRSRGTYIIQRSLRAMSTIAAVLGFIFILSGAITSLPHFGGGGTATSSSSGSAPAATGQHELAGTLTANHAPTATHQRQIDNQGTPITTPKPTGAATPAGTKSATDGPLSTQTNRGLSLPPILDLSRPEGFTGVGSILLLIGILGIIFTRRRQQRAT